METVQPKRSLADQTYDILLNAICTGEIKPGERLNQDHLAARLNVSRQPVNSAISVLKANRFVEDTGRRGVIVSAIDPDHFEAIYEYRSVIEPFAVTLATARRPADAHREAREILERGTRAARNSDPKALLQTDMEFHQMIYRWCGNQVISNSMAVNWPHIRRCMAQVLRDPPLAKATWEDHERIVERLLHGEAEAAAAEMKGHITRACDKTLALIRGRNPATGGA